MTVPARATPEPDTAAGLEVRDLAKRFGRFAALDGVSLVVEPGEFLAILGPSGSGKTTLLRTIAGLELPDRGGVFLGGRDFLALSARERRVGLVFQHYALFRHMSVAANIAFGLRARPASQRPSGRDIDARVERLLGLVQLAGMGRRRPDQLSGGQRQRVALARALAIEPRVLLLDEPFGALDAKVRKALRQWLRRLHDETGVTTLLVTHDREEALDIAHRVALLRHGRIEQVGTPLELRENPASAFVYDFLGDANQMPCSIDGAVARLADFDVPVANPSGLTGEALAWFRPHEAQLLADGPGIPVTILAILSRLGVTRAECRGPGGEFLEVDLPGGEGPGSASPGAELRLRPGRVHVFPRGVG